MRYLLLSSFLVLLLGCSSAYKHLKVTKANVTDLQKFKPEFKIALYKANVNVAGNYLSGLLLIKKMPDSSMRLVFSNEIGFKFFDLIFLLLSIYNSSFITHHSTSQFIPHHLTMFMDLMSLQYNYWHYLFHDTICSYRHAVIIQNLN